MEKFDLGYFIEIYKELLETVAPFIVKGSP